MNKKSIEQKGERKKTAGFTLIEIMVVVVILGLLATMVTINAPAILNKQRRRAAKLNLKNLQSAIEIYEMENGGKFPQTLNDLVNITDKNAIKFIKGSKIPKDPWGNDYVYKVGSVQGEDYCIISYGADGAEGGEGKNADINSCSPDEE